MAPPPLTTYVISTLLVCSWYFLLFSSINWIQSALHLIKAASFLHQLKVDALDDYGSVNAAKAHTPEWTTNGVWNGPCDYWMTPKHQEECALCKANRNASSSRSHTSGPIPYTIRRLEKEKELGREPTQYEMYVVTHTHKEKGSQSTTWVSEGAKRTLDDYKARLLEGHGDTDKPIHELHDPNLEVWKGTVGVKKGRLEGQPGERWSSRRNASCSSLFASEVLSSQVKKLTTELDKENSQIAAQKKALATQYEYMKELSAHCGYRPPPTYVQTSNEATNPVTCSGSTFEGGDDIDLT